MFRSAANVLTMAWTSDASPMAMFWGGYIMGHNHGRAMTWTISMGFASVCRNAGAVGGDNLGVLFVGRKPDCFS